MSLAAFLTIPAKAVTIPGDPADGRIRAGVVTTTAVEIGVGHYDDTNTPPTVGSTAILFFELPSAAAVGTLHNSALFFSLTDKSGSFVTNPANADIWGLGYVSAPTIDANWYLAADTDTRTGNDLGTGIGANPIVKIADNIMDSTTFDPASTNTPSRMAVPDPALTDFLELLYAQGAVSGDYAVIRMNIDEAASTLNRRFDIASADETDSSLRPELRMNENTVLLFDPFDDGSRLNDTDPRDTDWWIVTGTNNLELTVADDSGGIGSGNALSVVMLASQQRFIASFPPVTLADPGDFLQLTLTFRPTLVITPADERFRLGLLNSGGAPVGGDTSSVGSVGPHPGYMMKMSTDALGDLVLVQTLGGSFLGGTEDFLTRQEDVMPVNPPNPYTMIYTITRSSSTQMNCRLVLNDAVIIGADPGTDPDVVDWTFVDTFDSIGWGCNPAADIDFFADNIRVESSVPRTVPSDLVTTGAVELAFTTQLGIAYGLETATDLVASNWTDGAYSVLGDGGTLRLFDPDPTESDKNYRLVDSP